MPVETKYIVVRDGKEVGVFTSQQEAEAFEAQVERADKLAVVLTASVHDHRLDSEAIQAVARALAAREKDMMAIFSVPPKGKGKPARAARKPAVKRAPKSAPPVMEAVETVEAAPTATAEIGMPEAAFSEA